MHQITLPWAEPMSRFTVLFERLAIDVLKECDVVGACRILGLSWDEGWHLMQRAVGRGLLGRPVEAPVHLGVDEKAAGRGQDYITVVSDVDKGTVRFIADGRKESSLDTYFDTLPAAELVRIEAVAMDMWEPYTNSVRAHLDNADDKIVFDRFHIMGHMTKAVDTVRKSEHRRVQLDLAAQLLTLRTARGADSYRNSARSRLPDWTRRVISWPGFRQVTVKAVARKRLGDLAAPRGPHGRSTTRGPPRSSPTARRVCRKPLAAPPRSRLTVR